MKKGRGGIRPERSLGIHRGSDKGLERDHSRLRFG